MISRSLLTFFLLFTGTVCAHASTVWTDVAASLQAKNTSPLTLLPENYRLLRLDEVKMRSDLAEDAKATSTQYKNTSETLSLASTVSKTIEVPLPDGKTLVLKLTESSVMASKLSAQFPGIKTYRVDAAQNKGIYGAVDITERGFHAMLFMADGMRIFIDPRQSGDETYYVSYYDKHYHPAEKKPHQCKIEAHHQKLSDETSTTNTANRTGENLRTYRLAMAATGEYTAFHGGTVAGALSAIVTTVSRVNVIYERDLAVKLELIANNNLLIRTDTTTYTNNDTNEMISENQAQIDTAIGSANYDIGHVVSTSSGGLAYVGEVCNTNKAGGVTGSSQPIGDAFDIDFVAHEIGHQFGANHTFNSTTDSCGGSNRHAATAFEPGSGSTIQAYAGICGANNIQNDSDAMFHIKSIEEISTFVDNPTEGGSCGTPSSLNNQQPVANAGSDYTIPANTPFELTGIGSDADGDSLTYSWEQIDAGTATDINVVASDNALFRVFLPKTTPTRLFPQLTHILSNTVSTGETLPTVTRVLNFSFAVRDQKGGVASDTMVVNVSNSSAFKITSHGTNETLNPGTNTNLTWDVGSTNSAPINCSSVNILLSTDGGSTFTNVSGGTTANDGNESVTVPANVAASTTARFKISCANNIFFDISDADLTTTSLLDIGTPALSNAGTNNVADPGETIQLSVPLTNNAVSVATVVSGTLASSQAGVNVVAANSAYADIQASNTVNNTTAYEVNIPGSVTCGADIPLSLSTDFTIGTVINKVFGFSIPTGVATTATQNIAPSQTIPDSTLSGITSEITLSGLGVSAKPAINLDIDITHTYRGDLTLYLTSPAGTAVILKQSDSADGTDNLVGNYPTDFTPTQSLSAFDGENLDGVWTLKVADSFTRDTGVLNSWSLNYTSHACQTVSNTAPVASNSSISTNQGSAANATLTASDADNNVLTYSLLSSGTKGTAVITNASTGTFTYTPANGQSGSDSFTFKVNDGTVDSNTATVSVMINVATTGNNPPVADNSSFSINQNMALNETLQASDSDNDALTYSLISAGTKGTALITNMATGAFTYTPATDQTGEDTFTFRVRDGVEDSNTATVTITIEAVAGNPLTGNDSSGGGGAVSWYLLSLFIFLSWARRKIPE